MPGFIMGYWRLMQTLEGDHWGAAYVMWEIALLKELGFRLELNKCAGGGDVETLAYVSPKSGCAVSKAQAAPYKEKLLELPHFLRPIPPAHGGNVNEGSASELSSPPVNGGVRGGPEDILTGLKMTGYFLEHWVFNHHTKGVPETRVMFEERFWKSIV